MLLISGKCSGLIQAHETLLFPLQNLGFAINLKKTRLTLVKEIEFVGLIINSWLMNLALPQDKVLDIQNKCALLLASPHTTIMKLTELIAKMSFTTQVVASRKIQSRYL